MQTFYEKYLIFTLQLLKIWYNDLIKYYFFTQAAMTYAEAQMIIDDASRQDQIAKGLRHLNELAKKLKQKRIDAGYVVANCGLYCLTKYHRLLPHHRHVTAPALSPPMPYHHPCTTTTPALPAPSNIYSELEDNFCSF